MNYFQNIDLFGELSIQEQESLSDFCQLVKLQAGDTLFRQGDIPQALYIVKSGLFSIIKEIDGIETLISKVGQGEVLGEMAFFTQPSHRNASVVADKNAELIVVLQFSMQDLFQKYPYIHRMFRGIIEKRSRDNNTN